MESSASNVELLVGPYRDGKTSVVLNELLDLKEQNPLANILILVPSARYGKLLKDRIAVLLKERQAKGSKTKGFFGLEIQPFYQCCQKIISRTGFEPQLIAEEIRPAIIAHILSEMKAKGELIGLAAIAEFPGTGSSVLELVDELQRAGLTPNDVIGRLKASSCQESHLLELARVYQQYFQRLKELEFFDQKSLALAAREEIFKRKEMDYDLLLIDGFDRVSHLQAQIFAGLSKRARKTKMTFDYLSADTETSELDEKQKHGRSIIADDYRWKDSSFKELVNNLNPQILRRNAHEDNSVPTIESVSLLDPFLEMVEVARQVKAAIYQRGVKASELIVITRSPETYNGAIEAAFDDAGLNYFIDGSSKISELEAWRFMRALITLPDNDFRRKDLIDLLRSPYMKLEALSMQPSDVSNLDRNSFKSRVIGSKKTWAKFLANEDYSEYRSQILSLLEHLERSETEAAAAVHARYIEDLIDKYMQYPSSESNIRSAGAMHEREAIKALRRALKVLILQESVLKLKPESFKQFWTHLQTLVEKANYARPRPQSAALTICAAELAANMRFKEIYICGTIEGDFPRHQSAAGFLSPDEVRSWLSFGIDIRNPRQEAGFERALFHSLIERANNRVFLSMPQYTLKAEETFPSFYLSELAESHALQSHRMRPYEGSALRPVSLRDALSQVLWQHGLEGANSLAQTQSRVGSFWRKLEHSVSSTIHRAQGDHQNLFNGYLKDFIESHALDLPEQSGWTATKINDYGKCPFRFWATHILAVKPREEAEAGLNFALVGQFYHKVLEYFFTSFAKLNSDDQETKQNELLSSSFNRALSWLEERGDFQPGPYWEQEKKNLLFRVKRFLDRELRRLKESEHKYTPSMFEVNFGTKSPDSYPPFVLRTHNGKEIVFSGSIDRVDLLEDGSESSAGERQKLAHIIDYKSGSRLISAKEAEKGRNLQLPIYALALEESILPASRVAKADYLSIGAARSVGNINFDSEKHAEIKAASRNLVREYVQNVEQGIFTVKPNGQDVCKDCLHATVCRVAELKPQFAEENDASSD